MPPARAGVAAAGIGIAAGLAGVAGLVGTVLSASPGAAATTEYVVVDRHSGVAISGFDPVAYFVDAVPRLGKSGLEYEFAGAVWRFCNEGNMAAFVADPKVYMPRFGGYDPVDVARGVAVAGDPRLWLRVDDRVYLFATRGARATFAQDMDRYATTAEGMWKSVQLTLSP